MNFEASAGGRTFQVEVKAAPDGRVTVLVDGRPFELDAQPAGTEVQSVLAAGRSRAVGLARGASSGQWRVHLPGRVIDVELATAARGEGAAPHKGAGGPFRLKAPMPGRIVRVLVETGQEVQAGQGLIVMEAMKMENELKATRPGRVAQVAVQEKQAVETGALLAVVE